VALLNEECSMPKGSEENLFLKLSYAMKDREEKKFLSMVG
jgi:myosin heavy subunit